MKVLSLFDGISCARVALERAGFDIEKYYASEIDKYAIQIAQKNYPDTTQVGSVTELKGEDFKDIDLLIGGSPCQDLSIAKKDRQGLKGARSGLFYEYVRILNEVEPRYFILENVNSMPKEAKEQITEIMGVEPIMINAALVSAQNRKRLFWTNIPNVTQPEDGGILLRDILEKDVDEKYNVNLSEKYGLKGLYEQDSKSKALTATCWKGYGNDGVSTVRVGQIGKGGQGDRIYSPDGKSVNLSANGGGRGAKTGLYCVSVAFRNKNRSKHQGKDGEKYGDYKKDYVWEEEKSGKSFCVKSATQEFSVKLNDTIIRKLTPIECERLQSLPDNYTEGVSNTQRYKALGNAFNVEVVKHIVSFIPQNTKEKVKENNE